MSYWRIDELLDLVYFESIGKTFNNRTIGLNECDCWSNSSEVKSSFFQSVVLNLALI